MKEDSASVSEKVDDVLVKVMHRYRNFFLGPGINMDEYSVPLRNRPDFVAPLVTVMGYTFGLKSYQSEGDVFIEVSGNVYSSGFNLERFRERIREELSSSVAPGIMKNFAEDSDYQHISDLYKYADLFEFSAEEDVSIVTKRKKEETKI